MKHFLLHLIIIIVINAIYATISNFIFEGLLKVCWNKHQLIVNMQMYVYIIFNKP